MSTATRTKNLVRLEDVEQLTSQEKVALEQVTNRYSFRCNDYYLSLINWDDPDDPLRHAVIPSATELQDWGRLDPSDEKQYTIIPGLEHKYNSTVLMLVSNVCDSICRYCFRKRIFIHPMQECLSDIDSAVHYIREHDEVTNVLLTGGDPLALSTSRLRPIIEALSQIEHVKVIRIGSRVPAFNPYRITDDRELVEMIENFNGDSQKRLYIVTHFIHPRELTKPAVRAVRLLQRAGAITANQNPLLRKVNDKPEVLAELLAKLSFIGNVPYYVFQCRPAMGNKMFTVPIEQGYEIVEKAKAMVSGLAKRCRFVMSHSTGKIEIVGKTEESVYFKYHRTAVDEDSGRFMVFKSNPEACWFDDYEEAGQDNPLHLPYRSCGPD
ncbi:MAG: KamA family radical SAM protein [Planctomycetota bacterium]|jgi:KamA family protein